MPALDPETRFYASLLLDRLVWRGPPSASPRFAQRSALVESIQAASSHGAPRPPDPLPELPADAGRDAMLAASMGFRRPVVVRGFARDSPATCRWSPGYLRERLQGHRCGVLVLDERVRERDWDVPAPILDLDWGEYFDRMVDEPLYLNSSSELAVSCPELMGDLELDRLSETFREPGSDWDELVLTNFFIGSRQVFSAIHAAPAGNFFLNVAGRKRWTLTDPRWSVHLNPVTKPPFQYFRSAYGGYRAQAERGRGDDNPLVRLPRYEVVLQPGDLLYNAPWWWHEVENLDDFTVGCAARRVPRPLRPWPSWKNHRLFTLSSLYPAGRLLAWAHWIRQRLTGDTRPLRDAVNALNTRITRRYLTRRDSTR